MPWFRHIHLIPNFWFLCDGTHGTPDLRDNFPVGAGSAYTVGDSGGAATHTHPVTSDGHTHNIVGGSDLTDAPPAKHYQYDSREMIATTDPADAQPTFYATAYIMYQG